MSVFAKHVDAYNAAKAAAEAATAAEASSKVAAKAAKAAAEAAVAAAPANSYLVLLLRLCMSALDDEAHMWMCANLAFAYALKDPKKNWLIDATQTAAEHASLRAEAAKRNYIEAVVAAFKAAC